MNFTTQLWLVLIVSVFVLMSACGPKDLPPYSVEITGPEAFQDAKATIPFVIPVTIKNKGTDPIGGPQSKQFVSYHLLDKDGKMLKFDNVRTPFPLLVLEKTLNVSLKIEAISKPDTYIIMVDLVHEGVTWFAKKRTNAKRIQLVVSENK